MIHPVDVQRPLTPEEITELEKFLQFNGKGIHAVIQLQGFFCAILMAAHPISPYLWRPVVFGENFYFQNNDEAICILDLVLRYLTQVNSQKSSLLDAFLCDREEDIDFQNHKHHELKGMWRMGYEQGKALWNKEDALMPMTLADFVCTEIDCKKLTL